MLPNFLIIGSQKGGTTSLYNVLRQHPQIYMSETKEINFFFRSEVWQRGVEYYQSFFAEVPETAKAWGEASPGYICHPAAPERIHGLMPEVKLILVARNPIERAYSQYWDNRRHLSEPRHFSEVVDLYLSDYYLPGVPGYFSRGVYMRYIRKYLGFFPPEQLLVLVFEELVRDPVGFYRRIFEFLGVNADFDAGDFARAYNPAMIWSNPFYDFVINNPHYNRNIPMRMRRFFFWGKRSAFKYPPMPERTRERLRAFYQPWNDELGKFLGRDLSEWQ